jgi:hypothetical protein
MLQQLTHNFIADILQMGKRSLLFERYTQVFDDKHGFVNNLRS